MHINILINNSGQNLQYQGGGGRVGGVVVVVGAPGCTLVSGVLQEMFHGFVQGRGVQLGQRVDHQNVIGDVYVMCRR